MGESERGTRIEQVTVEFWCAAGHHTRVIFAQTAEIPESWDCQGCGRPAGRDRDNPPAAVPTAPYKTHLAYVRERRSDADAEVLLAEALRKLRAAS
jgi:hypothetical protein